MNVQETARLLESQGCPGMASLVRVLAEQEERGGKRVQFLSVPLTSELSTSFGNSEVGALDVLKDMAQGKGLPSADERVLAAFDEGCRVVAFVMTRVQSGEVKFVPLSTLKNFGQLQAIVQG